MTVGSREPIPTVSQEALRDIHDRVCQMAIENLTTHGELEPAVLAFHVQEGAKQPSKMMVIDPQGVIEMSSDPESKTLLMAMMRDLIDASTPVHQDASKALGHPINLVVHITEAWILMGKCAEHALDNGETPASSPDRGEAIAVSLYCSDGIYTGLMPIHRDADGKPVVEFQTVNLNLMRATRVEMADAARAADHEDGARIPRGPSLH